VRPFERAAMPKLDFAIRSNGSREEEPRQHLRRVSRDSTRCEYAIVPTDSEVGSFRDVTERYRRCRRQPRDKEIRLRELLRFFTGCARNRTKIPAAPRRSPIRVQRERERERDALRSRSPRIRKSCSLARRASPSPSLNRASIYASTFRANDLPRSKFTRYLRYRSAGARTLVRRLLFLPLPQVFRTVPVTETAAGGGGRGPRTLTLLRSAARESSLIRRSSSAVEKNDARARTRTRSEALRVRCADRYLICNCTRLVFYPDRVCRRSLVDTCAR